METYGRACGADVGGVGQDTSHRYSLWVRSKALWDGGCAAPLRRRGDACVCCTCPPGESHNGGQCVQCPAGRYKTTDDDEPCLPCAGTDLLDLGQTWCPHTLEVKVVVAEAYIIEDVVRYNQVFIAVKWNETGLWSSDVAFNASEVFVAGGEASVNVTLKYVGTPVAVRYHLTYYTDFAIAIWRPETIAMRVNKGRWYGPSEAGDLCDVNSRCTPSMNCPSLYNNSDDCTVSSYISSDVPVFPLAGNYSWEGNN
mmetsp:Transcript_8692/g.19232  ORF Transcript_8692/g.19232 Transcript_8692/m.19232 type:complete len:254 (+) Transcript_8692:447-1208(+)